MLLYMARVRRRATFVYTPLLLASVALGGCGHRSASTDGAATATPGRPPSSAHVSASPRASAAAVDRPCPGEVPTPSASVPPTDPAAADEGPPDYSSNEGFRNPYPLTGADRCSGLAEARRITTALEPLRVKHEFTPEAVRDRLVGLGLAPSKLTVAVSPTGVSFTVDESPVCLDGTIDPASTAVDPHGVYPDSTQNDGCTPREGGH